MPENVPFTRSNQQEKSFLAKKTERREKTFFDFVVANEVAPVEFVLSKGNSHDAPVGREVISTVTLPKSSTHLLMDKAYEDGTTRKVVVEAGLVPVMPPRVRME